MENSIGYVVRCKKPLLGSKVGLSGRFSIGSYVTNTGSSKSLSKAALYLNQKPVCGPPDEFPFDENYPELNGDTLSNYFEKIYVRLVPMK